MAYTDWLVCRKQALLSSACGVNKPVIDASIIVNKGSQLKPQIHMV
ncbi:unnamed protein product, partial [Rotaria sp. Silwood2]